MMKGGSENKKCGLLQKEWGLWRYSEEYRKEYSGTSKHLYLFCTSKTEEA